MAKIDVYYDYTDEGLAPKWMFIKFGRGKFDWSKNFVYLPVEVPFKCKTAEEFVDIEMTLTITIAELVMNLEKEGMFGININTVKKRVNKLRGKGEFPFTLEDIETFVIQICDLEEVLAIDCNELYAWR